MIDMVVSFLNKLLGWMLDTYCLDGDVPPTFIDDTIRLLKLFHPKHKRLTKKEMKKINGMLVHIADSVL